MPPAVRRAALALHLTVSVGWIGAVAAYLALDITASTAADPERLRASYLGMQTIAGDVILPLAVASLLTGLLMSLGTKWGLFRHYWVLISLVLTAVAVVVLYLEMQTIDHLARVAADPGTTSGQLRSLGGTLVHSIGGMIVLAVVLVLNVCKPRGLTSFGWRRLQRSESGA